MGVARGAAAMRDSYAYPPRGLSREEAARYVGVGTTTFDGLVQDGRMPKPFRIGSLLPHTRLMLWLQMHQHLLEVELVDQMAANRAAGVVLLAVLVRLDLGAGRHEPNPPAAFRQTECGGFPSATSSPFASA